MLAASTTETAGSELQRYPIKCRKMASAYSRSTLGILRKKFPRLETKDGIGLPELEASLERSIAAQKAHAFARSMLSVGVRLGISLLKEEEVNDRRKIAKGKEFRMSESDVGLR